ncbi:MAG: biotin--[acetyl-CoA-carboxylase] ligase [Gordonia sp. (in: high G+C Gram-positive bacteria)]
MTAAHSLPDAARLRQMLAGTRWHDVDVVAETGSTNADLVARAAEPGLDGTVLIAGYQSAGRGRHARTWETPHGQLAISAAVAAPAEGTEKLGWLSLLTGLAVREAVSEVAGAEVILKWPNDVLAADGRKVSGILAEYRPSSNGGGVAVIGTGINVDLPEQRVPTAVSVAEVAGHDVDPTELAAAYLRALSERLRLWPNDLAGLAEAYRAASGTLGQQVRLILPGDVEVVGEAVDVDAQGGIVVDGPNGRITALAGDVTHLRQV